MASVKSWLTQNPDTGEWCVFRGKQLQGSVANWAEGSTPKSPTPKVTIKSGNDSVVHVDLQKNGTGYGIVFDGARNAEDGDAKGYGVFISAIKPRTVADSDDRVQVGLQVLSINDVDVSNGTFLDLKPALQRNPNNLRLSLTSNPTLVQAYPKRSSVHNSPVKPQQIFSLSGATTLSTSDSIRKGKVAIAGATEVESSADNDGGLIAVAGITDVGSSTDNNGDGDTDDDAANRVNADNSDAVDNNDNVLSITLENVENKGFGLKFAGARNDDDGNAKCFGVYISGVKEGSVAAADGRIKEGMQIVNMNGVAVEYGTFEDLKGALTFSQGGTMLVKLVENAELLKAYNFTPSSSAASAFKPTLRANKNATTDADTNANNNTNNANNNSNEGSSKTASCTLVKRGDEGYGLKFTGCKGEQDAQVRGYGVFIGGVTQGTVASEAGVLHEGQRITMVNGVDLSDNATLKDLKVAISKSAGALSFSVIDDEVAYGRYAKAADTIVVTIEKGSLGYGIKFGGPKTKAEGDDKGFGVCVQAVIADSAAALHPQVKPGLQIVKFNGVDLTHGTFEDLKMIMTQTAGSVTIELRENTKLADIYMPTTPTSPSTLTTLSSPIAHESSSPKKAEPTSSSSVVVTSVGNSAPLATISSRTVVTTVTNDGAGFGFTVGGAKTDVEGQAKGFGIFITNIKHGSSTADNTDVHVGDQIISVNNADLRQGTVSDFRSVVRGNDGTLTLGLENNPALLHAYQFYPQPSPQSTHNNPTPTPTPTPTSTLTTPIATEEAKTINNTNADTGNTTNDTYNYNSAAATVVSLTKDQELGFGMTFSGAKTRAEAENTNSYGVFVSKTKEGTPARLSGKILDGHQIMAINGVDLSNATFVELKDTLKGCGDTMEITMKNPTQSEVDDESKLLSRTSSGPTMAPPPPPEPSSSPVPNTAPPPPPEEEDDENPIMVISKETPSTYTSISILNPLKPSHKEQDEMKDMEDVLTLIDPEVVASPMTSSTRKPRSQKHIQTPSTTTKEIPSTTTEETTPPTTEETTTSTTPPSTPMETASPVLKKIFESVNTPRSKAEFSAAELAECFALEEVDRQLKVCVSENSFVAVHPEDIVDIIRVKRGDPVPAKEVLRAGVAAQSGISGAIKIQLVRESAEASFGFKLGQVQSCMAVIDVDEEGVAAGLLQAGDVITEINAVPTKSFGLSQIEMMIAMSDKELHLKIKPLQVNPDAEDKVLPQIPRGSSMRHAQSFSFEAPVGRISPTPEEEESPNDDLFMRNMQQSETRVRRNSRDPRPPKRKTKLFVGKTGQHMSDILAGATNLGEGEDAED